MSVYARKSSKLRNFTDYLVPLDPLISSHSMQTPTQNSVYYVPIRVPFPVTINGMLFLLGGTAGGNIYCAVYSDDGTLSPLTRLVVSASTALAGINQKQVVALANTRLQQGIVWAAILKSVTADTIVGMYPLDAASSWASAGGLMVRFFMEAMGAYLSPPAVATPVEKTGAQAQNHPYLALRVSEC
jgi:hypothetical protein